MLKWNVRSTSRWNNNEIYTYIWTRHFSLTKVSKTSAIFSKHAQQSFTLFGSFLRQWILCTLNKGHDLHHAFNIPIAITLRIPRHINWNLDNQHFKNNQTSPPSHNAQLLTNSVYDYKRIKYIVTYVHKAAYSPVKSKWIQDINAGFFYALTRPNFWACRETPREITCYRQRSPTPNTSKSTKHIKSITTSTTKITPRVMTISPVKDDIRQNVVSLKIIEVSGNCLSDQTARFPVTSSKE